MLTENSSHPPIATEAPVGNPTHDYSELQRQDSRPKAHYGYVCVALVDVLAVTLAVISATLLTDVIQITRHGVETRHFLAPFLFERVWQLGLLCLSLFLWLSCHGHYRSRKALSDECRQILTACAVMFVIDGYIQYTLKLQPSRIWITLTWIFISFYLITSRIATKNILSKMGFWSLRTLIVGSENMVAKVGQLISKDSHMGYGVHQELIIDSDSTSDYTARFDQLMHRKSVEYVVFAFDKHLAVSDALTTKISTQYRVPFGIVPTFKQVSSVDMEVQNFVGEDFLLLHTSRTSASIRLLVAKRIFDVVVTLAIGAVLCLPILCIALLIKADGGKVFYGSTRIGLKGRKITVYKFRTMVPNANDILKDLLANDPEKRAEWQRDYKLVNDPRITRIGQFLRNSSLDELPQLFNVLRGDMSLVGPRPIVPDEQAIYAEKASSDNAIMIYNQIKPGITGLWQVSGRNDIEYERRIELNNWYVKNWTIWGDLAILCKTIHVVISKAGAR